MMKLFGYENDNVPDTEMPENIFVVDGYAFGERLLEGVLFEVSFADKTVTSVAVEARSADYFNGLNTKQWLAAAKKYAQGILSQGGDEVSVPERIKAQYPQMLAFYLTEA